MFILIIDIDRYSTIDFMYVWLPNVSLLQCTRFCSKFNQL